MYLRMPSEYKILEAICNFYGDEVDRLDMDRQYELTLLVIRYFSLDASPLYHKQLFFIISNALLLADRYDFKKLQFVGTLASTGFISHDEEGLLYNEFDQRV